MGYVPAGRAPPRRGADRVRPQEGRAERGAVVGRRVHDPALRRHLRGPRDPARRGPGRRYARGSGRGRRSPGRPSCARSCSGRLRPRYADAAAGDEASVADFQGGRITVGAAAVAGRRLPGRRCPPPSHAASCSRSRSCASARPRERGLAGSTSDAALPGAPALAARPAPGHGRDRAPHQRDAGRRRRTRRSGPTTSGTGSATRRPVQVDVSLIQWTLDPAHLRLRFAEAEAVLARLRAGELEFDQAARRGVHSRVRGGGRAAGPADHAGAGVRGPERLPDRGGAFPWADERRRPAGRAALPREALGATALAPSHASRKPRRRSSRSWATSAWRRCRRSATRRPWRR